MEMHRESLQLALALPRNQQMTMHVHLTFSRTNAMILLTTATTGEAAGLAPMGSFVYAMPNVRVASYGYSSDSDHSSD